jgi:C4-dicarboxylate transporter DctM subunit
MEPTTIGLIGLGILFILMFAEVPIGFAMGIVGFLGFASIMGWQGALGMLKQIPYTAAANSTMAVIPLFLLMGQFAYQSKMVEEFYYNVHKWIGHLRGGLAVATFAACAGFAAICGTSLAVSSTMTKVALPEMRRYNYDPRLATGSIASGGTLGILIPPSLSFVVYGIITNTSVGKLLIAGILPGILLTTLFCLTIVILTAINPTWAPRGPKATWKERLQAAKGGWEVFLLFFLVVGGIWTGIFTATEAAAIGAFFACLITVFKRRVTWKSFLDSLLETVKPTGMIFAIVIGALIFNFFMAVSKLPQAMSSFLLNMNASPLFVLLFILFIFLILGCLMDTLAMTLLALPVVFPTVQAMGYDPIFFGVLCTVMSEIGMITPPVGISVFIVAGMAKDIPMYTVFQGIIPFLITFFVLIAILITFPQIALWLPAVMKGG